MSHECDLQVSHRSKIAFLIAARPTKAAENRTVFLEENKHNQFLSPKNPKKVIHIHTSANHESYPYPLSLLERLNSKNSTRRLYWQRGIFVPQHPNQSGILHLRRKQKEKACQEAGKVEKNNWTASEIFMQ